MSENVVNWGSNAAYQTAILCSHVARIMCSTNWFPGVQLRAAKFCVRAYAATFDFVYARTPQSFVYK